MPEVCPLKKQIIFNINRHHITGHLNGHLTRHLNGHLTGHLTGHTTGPATGVGVGKQPPDGSRWRQRVPSPNLGPPVVGSYHVECYCCWVLPLLGASIVGSYRCLVLPVLGADAAAPTLVGCYPCRSYLFVGWYGCWSYPCWVHQLLALPLLGATVAVPTTYSNHVQGCNLEN